VSALIVRLKILAPGLLSTYFLYARLPFAAAWLPFQYAEELLFNDCCEIGMAGPRRLS
jgi:hypothetical protein